MTKHALIVEPYLSGGLLPAAFSRDGIASVGIHLRPMTHKIAATFRAEEFPRHLTFGGDLDELHSALADLEIVAVVAGQEAGVETADRLASSFGVPANQAGQSAARRDKYLMHQNIAAAGLRAIQQTRSSDVNALIAWIEANVCWPAVIKPVNSGGTDGVRFCNDPGEVAAAFNAEIGRVNLLGFANSSMLAQELIDGIEYIVDSVSGGGRHHVVNIARYEKEISQAGTPIYRAIRFLDPGEWDRHGELIDYDFAVLNALGITVGPSHSEVFVDARGPVLVETGARLCGAMVPKYLDEISDRSILDMVVQSYVDLDRFAAAGDRPVHHRARLCAFVPKTGLRGVVTERPGDALIRGLKSFRDIGWFAHIGGRAVPTRDLMTGLAMVFLCAADDEQIEADIARIREWEEEECLIRVNPTPAAEDEKP